MDKEHVHGAVDKAKGATKDAAGKLLDNPKLQSGGKLDKAKGTANLVVGDLKDTARNAAGKARLKSTKAALGLTAPSK